MSPTMVPIGSTKNVINEKISVFPEHHGSPTLGGGLGQSGELLITVAAALEGPSALEVAGAGHVGNGRAHRGQGRKTKVNDPHEQQR